MSVVRRGNAWCVVHGHPQKEGSPTDKPAGSVIKCYLIEEHGDEGAKALAVKMHQAILISKAQRKEA